MERLIKMFSVLMMILLVSCGMNMKMSKLKPGMKKQEIINVLGRPNGFKVEGEYESLQYTNRLVSGWVWDFADYFVILKKGELVECGSGEVRTREVGGVNTLILVPLK